MIEVENTDVNIVRNLIPMRNHMPASAYGLKAISDWLFLGWSPELFDHQSIHVQKVYTKEVSKGWNMYRRKWKSFSEVVSISCPAIVAACHEFGLHIYHLSL